MRTVEQHWEHLKLANARLVRLNAFRALQWAFRSLILMLSVVLVECSRLWFAPSGLLNTELSIRVEPQYGDYGVPFRS